MNAKSWFYEQSVVIFLVSVAILLALLMSGCGSDYGSSKEPAAGPPPVVAGDPEFAAVYPIIKADCGGCHNGTVHPLAFNSAAKFKTAKVAARISNGSMPPAPKKISAENKAKLLEYIQ